MSWGLVLELGRLTHEPALKQIHEHHAGKITDQVLKSYLRDGASFIKYPHDGESGSSYARQVHMDSNQNLLFVISIKSILLHVDS